MFVPCTATYAFLLMKIIVDALAAVKLVMKIVGAFFVNCRLVQIV